MIGKPSSLACDYVLRRIAYLEQQEKENNTPLSSDSASKDEMDEYFSSRHLVQELTPQQIESLKSRCLMVGDRISTDIYFGRMNNIASLLTLTGVTSFESIQSSLNTASSATQPPTFYVHDFGDLLNGSEYAENAKENNNV